MSFFGIYCRNFSQSLRPAQKVAPSAQTPYNVRPMTAWRFLFFSIGLHILVWWFAQQQISFKSPFNDKKVEITVVDRSEPKYIVPRAMPPAKKSKSHQQPKFLGAEDRQVEKQTSGRKTQLAQSLFKPDIPKPQNQEKLDLDKGEAGWKLKPKKFNFQDGLIGANQSAEDVVPEVEKGPMTSLNSERFIFNSFFQRIEEKIFPKWEARAISSYRSLSQRDLERLSGRVWTTIVEVFLDREGHYLETVILSPSSVPQFDQIIIATFKEADFFPNPPTPMIKSDGKVHITYRFDIDLSGGYWARR